MQKFFNASVDDDHLESEGVHESFFYADGNDHVARSRIRKDRVSVDDGYHENADVYDTARYGCAHDRDLRLDETKPQHPSIARRLEMARMRIHRE